MPLSRKVDAKIQPLRANYDAVSERVVDDDGCFHIVTKQECDATIQAVHDYSELVPRKSKADGMRYAGSVPIVQAQIWAKECGFAIGTQGWNEYATKKLNNGTFAKLKAKLR